MKRATLIIALLTLSVLAYAQSGKTIKGKVSDSFGEAIIGATVMEKGTNNGTITDINGEYSLRIKDENSVVEFSSLSYMTESKAVKGLQIINVVLKDDALSLSAVVVTGYGQTVTKDKLTAAISKVTSDDIGVGSHGNALKALSGTVTGVRIASTTGQPGTSPAIVIRGGAALNGTGHVRHQQP